MRNYDKKKVLEKISKERVRRMARCPECLTPRLLRLLFKWDDGGTLTLRLLDRNFRFAFLENALLHEIIDTMMEHFGEEEVFQIIRSTERGSAGGYVAMLFGAERWWLKPLSLLATHSYLLDIILEQNVVLLGYGAGEIVEKKMPYAAVYIRNPYNITLFQADLEACYLDAREREITMKPEPTSKEECVYLFSGRAETNRKPNIFKRYRVESPSIIPAENPYKFARCSRCSIPKEISQFWWDARNGMIINKDTGRRVILWPCYALERLLGELEKQLGKEAGASIFEVVRQYQKRNIESDGVGFSPEEKLAFIETEKEGQYRLLLKHLACMGLGHGEAYLESDNKIKITMTNPLVPLVTSGLMAGMVEALEGCPVKVSWEEGTESTIYTLKW